VAARFDAARTHLNGVALKQRGFAMSIPLDADKICKSPLGFAKNVGATVFGTHSHFYLNRYYNT
jgi:hypothetical protein